MHAIGLGLAVEVIQRGQARAVVQQHFRRVLPGLLGLVVGGQEAIAQGAGHRGQLAFLRQQQGDLLQRLAGQLLQFAQRLRQLFGGGVAGVLVLPGVDGGQLLVRGAGVLGGQGQAQPAVQITVAGTDQLALRQAGDQRPDGFVVGLGGFAGQQRGDEYAFASGGQGLAVGFESASLDQLGADLLFHWQFGQALQARVLQGLEGALGLAAGHRQLGVEGGGEHLLGGLQAVQRHFIEDACGAADVLLAPGLVGG